MTPSQGRSGEHVRLQRRTNRTNILDELYGSADGAAPADEQQDAAATPAVESKGAATPSTVPIDATPAWRATSRLTRRTGGQKTKSRRSEIFDRLLMGSSAPAQGDEGTSAVTSEATQGSLPRSKKYRMELDEEDRRQSQMDEAEGSSAPARPLPQSEEGSATRLESVPEHAMTDANSARARRKRAADDQGPNRKRPRSVSVATQEEIRPSPSLEAANDVIRSRPTPHGGIAQGDQPDTEPQFLRALNTLKSRRKRMDEFDDEFNKLKIAKPVNGAASRQNAADQCVDEDFEAFRKLAEDELQMGVRGNFVQVDFVPLVVKKTGKVTPSFEAGVPNFKKFRPKGQKANQPSQRTPVTMQLTDAVDYGIGETYWKDGAAAERANRIEADGQDVELLEPAAGGRAHLALSDDSEDGVATSRRPADKGKGRARKTAHAVSDVDELDVPTRPDLDLTGIDSDDPDDSILAPAPRRSPTKGAKRKAQVAQLDVSDDDQDDDDGNFAGFGSSTTTGARRGATRSTQRRQRI